MKTSINEISGQGDFGASTSLGMQSQKERTWFRQKPYVFITAGLLILYSLIASKSPETLAAVDYFLTPIIDSLRFIGLGITKPFMDGPMPERFYTNMVGIGVWGVVAYNLRSVLWFVMKRGRIADRREVWDRLKDKWGIWGMRLAIVSSVLFGVLCAGYCTLVFLNGIHGWFVFHVRDFIVPPAFVMMWVYPGALVIALGWTVVWYIGLMFLKLYQSLFLRE
ncbi:MAG: hypothetical protein A2063_11000 [Gallionellales bacterium GWA2_60_142]|nr:MAG: hypothetical protein A2063_11000 [Gallionellales bacterium GWA2_60_142]